MNLRRSWTHCPPCAGPWPYSRALDTVNGFRGCARENLLSSNWTFSSTFQKQVRSQPTGSTSTSWAKRPVSTLSTDTLGLCKYGPSPLASKELAQFSPSRAFLVVSQRFSELTPI